MVVALVAVALGLGELGGIGGLKGLRLGGKAAAGRRNAIVSYLVAQSGHDGVLLLHLLLKVRHELMGVLLVLVPLRLQVVVLPPQLLHARPQARHLVVELLSVQQPRRRPGEPRHVHGRLRVQRASGAACVGTQDGSAKR